MHAPPPFQVTVCHFGVWRIVCAGLAAVSWLVIAAWAMSARQAHVEWLALSFLLLVVATLSLLLQIVWLVPVSVRWDGQLWHVGPAASKGQEPQAGHLAIALDLGAWLLLRFVADGARRGRWLPVQRRGHELAWHGLRATVYCARPVSPPTAAPF